MWARIYLILGPMFSGKTSELLRRYRRSMISEVPTLLIKYAADTRYSGHAVTTHDHDSNSADIICSRLFDALSAINAIKAGASTPIIYIDEIQFFEDKLEFCDMVSRMGVEIHAAGLAQDYKRKPFPQMGELMALAYSVVYLHAVCFYCKCDRACYSHKYIHVTDGTAGQEDIGGSEKYHAVCTACYGTQADQR